VKGRLRLVVSSLARNGLRYGCRRTYRGFSLRGGLHGSGWPLAILTITCLLYTVTGHSQTPRSKPEQQMMPTSGETARIVTKPVLQCPPAGSHPAASIKGHHKVTLTWNARPGGNIEGYCLYRGTKKHVAKNKKPKTPFTCAGCEQINVIPVVSTGCVDDLVKDGSTYYYVATALDAHQGLSPASNEVRAEIRGPASSHSDASPYGLCRGPEAPQSK
jgi:hypothetical protein